MNTQKTKKAGSVYMC